jgi:hypothetical protein
VVLVVGLGMVAVFSRSVATSRPDPAFEGHQSASARAETTREEFDARRKERRGKRGETAVESHRPGEQNPD